MRTYSIAAAAKTGTVRRQKREQRQRRALQGNAVSPGRRIRFAPAACPDTNHPRTVWPFGARCAGEGGSRNNGARQAKSGAGFGGAITLRLAPAAGAQGIRWKFSIDCH